MANLKPEKQVLNRMPNRKAEPCSVFPGSIGNGNL